MYNVHLTHSLLCFEFVELTLNRVVGKVCDYGRLHCHHALDVRVWIIVDEGKVIEFEVEDAFHVGVDNHPWQAARLSAHLLAHLLEMVGVDVCVAESVHEIAGLKTRDLSHHHEQQGVGSDVERHAEEDVGAALIEL